MLSLRKAWLPGALLVAIASACGNGGTTGTGGSGGAAASSSTGATATSAASTGGAGGAGATTTTSTTGSTGGSISYVPSGFACSGKTPSLANDVVPITSASCTTGPSCHVALHTAGGVNGMFVDRLAEECNDGRLMVNPGDPEGSYVIHKITSHNLCANQPAMPQVGGPLTAAQIQVIYDWICEGAPSN
jgi:hypothetical protein